MPNKLTIEQITDLKKDMELSILGIMAEFEYSTGVSIDGIDITPVYELGKGPRIGDINVRCLLSP